MSVSTFWTIAKNIMLTVCENGHHQYTFPHKKVPTDITHCIHVLVKNYIRYPKSCPASLEMPRHIQFVLEGS